MKYLDKTGLEYLKNKLVNIFQSKLVSGTNIKTINNETLLDAGNINLGNSKHYYGTCSTSSSTRAKVVDCSGFVLETGAMISVLFTNSQTYNGAPYLNVNGTGNITIQYKSGSNLGRYMWSAGEVMDFTYDGTYWVCHGRAIASTTYYGVTKLVTSAGSSSENYALTARSLYYFGNNTVCPYYSASSTYEVGDKVRHTYSLYECIVPIEEAEEWNAEHWQQIETIQEQIEEKQDTLVSGTNIKTINNQSLLGEGNINISGGGGTATDVQINGTSITSNDVANIITEGTYNASTNKIATMDDIENIVDLSSYSVGDTISDSTMVSKLKSNNVTVLIDNARLKLVDIDTSDGDVAYIYAVMNKVDGADYIVLVEDNNNLLFGLKDSTSLQIKIDSSNKLDADLVDASTSTNKFVTSSDKTTWSAKYDKPNGGIPSTDLASEVQTSLGKADTALQSISSSDVTTALGYTPYNSTNPNGYTSNTGTITSVKMNGTTVASSGEADLGTVITDISGKQDIEDNTLQTVYKTVPAAINEVNSVAKGANQALSYSNYQSMVNAFNALNKETYQIGQNVYINTVEVPDLWISGKEDISIIYIYTTDEALVSAIQTNGYVQIGYYRLSQLETQKVDLKNYVQNTDYATSSTGGAVKVNSYYGLTTSSGTIIGSTNSYSDYTAKGNSFIICKGSLENVLTGKNLETTGNKVTSLSSSSTDTEYPSAKAVYDTTKDLIPQGGRLTAPLTANGGDESTAGKIILEQSTGGQITNSSTSTLLGFASAGDTDLKCGSTSYALTLRGSGTRPKYNGNELALKSDIPTSADTGFIPVDANKSGFNLNTVYDASLKLFGNGTNGPKGITYGTVLTMPYRKASGNTKPDFGAQIFIPNGDDDIEHRNSLFFRTSLGNTWNEWQEISEKKPILISTDTTITDKNINVDDCVYSYGHGIGWYTTTNTAREHIIFSPYLLKGTTVEYIEANWSSSYVFSLSMGPSPEHDQTSDRRTNDSGWVTSSTATGTLTGEIGVGFAYDSSTKTFTMPYDGYLGINVKKSDNSTISSADLLTIRNWVKNNFVISGWTLPRIYRDRVDTLSPNDFNGNINTINHRGWYECPENTLIAYRNSRYKGYKMVETDVDFTSDDVPVLLHDSTINRTARNADGSTISSTININSITFEQARTYDFGIYKGEEFRGEKIPSFQEFITLCKNTGMHPYIELKGTQSSAHIQSLLNIVKRTGMRGKVTFISFQLANLTTVKGLDNKARLGYITEASTITQSIVNDAASLKNDYNEVFLDAAHAKINQNVADMCMTADIGLEAWTVDTFTDSERLPLYVSGFTTNSLNFDKAYLSANGFYYE